MSALSVIIVIWWHQRKARNDSVRNNNETVEAETAWLGASYRRSAHRYLSERGCFNLSRIPPRTTDCNQHDLSDVVMPLSALLIMPSQLPHGGGGIIRRNPAICRYPQNPGQEPRFVARILILSVSG